jgi:hypothetical protein
MEAATQTEEEQVNIIEPSDPITPVDIGNFALRLRRLIVENSTINNKL